MKRIFIFSFFISNQLFAQGTWTPKANFPGAGRLTAVAFTIGNYGYMGVGGGLNWFDDFWQYDPLGDTWTQKANFPGGQRGYSAGFAIGNKGYIGAGADALGSYYNDFWEYDPSSNLWTQKANVGGAQRAAPSSFSIGSYGYLGTGVDPTYTGLQDVWRYNPSINSWTLVANFPATARSDIDRANFVIGNKLYWGTGLDVSTLIPFNDFWEYDPATNTWTQKANVPGPPRFGAVGFSICGMGFLGCGADLSFAVMNDLWMYNPTANTWSSAASFPPGGRADLPAFVINGAAYLGTGTDNFLEFNDWWGFSISGASVSIIATDSIICTGQNVTLSASGGSSYTWSTGATTSSITVTPSVTTTYSVMTSGFCGVVTANVTILVASVSASPANPRICEGSSIQLNAAGDTLSSYVWSPPDGLSCTNCPSPLATPTATTTYYVSNPVGCGGTDSVTVVVLKSCCDDSDLETVVPNAFSPNGDGQNDKFCVPMNDCILDFVLTIYDRWGEKIFETKEFSECWDGTYKGKELNTAVFVFYFEGTLISTEKFSQKGTLSLIR